MLTNAHAERATGATVAGQAVLDQLRTPRSRRQVAAVTGVKIGLLRSLEDDGLLPAGDLTAADELVVRALTWADGARGGDPEHERTLERALRATLSTTWDGDVTANLVVVLVDDLVFSARDDLEALLLVRGRRDPVTLLPVGAWIAELVRASAELDHPPGRPPAETEEDVRREIDALRLTIRDLLEAIKLLVL